jgi:hypothetical protein
MAACAVGLGAPQTLNADGTELARLRPDHVPSRSGGLGICARAGQCRQLALLSEAGRAYRRVRAPFSEGPPLWTPRRRLGRSHPSVAPGERELLLGDGNATAQQESRGRRLGFQLSDGKGAAHVGRGGKVLPGLATARRMSGTGTNSASTART